MLANPLRARFDRMALAAAENITVLPETVDNAEGGRKGGISVYGTILARV
jgi:hypothetical protein